MKVAFSICIFLFIGGCSNKRAYEGIQASNRVECAKLPPSQYDECIANANKLYYEYEAERKEVMGQ